jgi:hypothetical protein
MKIYFLTFFFYPIPFLHFIKDENECFMHSLLVAQVFANRPDFGDNSGFAALISEGTQLQTRLGLKPSAWHLIFDGKHQACSQIVLFHYNCLR